MNSESRKSSYDSGRMSANGKTKVYEKMLLTDLSGRNKSNQPMHAVLESTVDYDGQCTQEVRDRALIHYLASLANSNNTDDKFDFDFVESLIVNGADVNSTDKTGQTIFHEVARSWNKDVAAFLIDHGADANRQDTFGRSPLHVAAAVDHAEMVEFLMKRGADVSIATKGEGQMPIHYAAKNGACRSLKMLLGYGADIDSRDSRNRTPLQVAADVPRSETAKLLVQNGAPASVKDDMGNSALALLIEKLPSVAVEALDQLHSASTINRKEYFFLNYLEGNHLSEPESPSYSALEVAVQQQEFAVILHPVMKRLIFVKWQKFGRNGAIFDLGYNLVYAILWVILAVTTPAHGYETYMPLIANSWRLVLSIIILLMTVEEIRKQITGTIRTRNRQAKWISWRVREMREDLAYCHPRWPQEEMFLKSEIAAVEDAPLATAFDAWLYFDWFALALILASVSSHLVYVLTDSPLSHIIYLRILTFLLLVLWLRMLKYVRPFEGAGPFVVIFAHVAQDIINWAMLLSVITIPFACAFFITFGGISSTPVTSYSSVSSLLYNMFSMMVVNDHHFDLLEEANPTMARILCGAFIGIMAIVCLNILIALLSDTFSRVYSNAVAIAITQRAKTILLIEKSLGAKKRRAYEDFIKTKGSPEAIQLQRDITKKSENDDDSKSPGILKDHLNEIHSLLNERFGKKYGEGQTSDFDIIKENSVAIQKSLAQESIHTKRLRDDMRHVQNALAKLCESQNIRMDDIELGWYTDDQESVVEPIQTNAYRRKSFLTTGGHALVDQSTKEDNYRTGHKNKHINGKYDSRKAYKNPGYQEDEEDRAFDATMDMNASIGLGNKRSDELPDNSDECSHKIHKNIRSDREYASKNVHKNEGHKQDEGDRQPEIAHQYRNKANTVDREDFQLTRSKSQKKSFPGDEYVSKKALGRRKDEFKDDEDNHTRAVRVKRATQEEIQRRYSSSSSGESNGGIAGMVMDNEIRGAEPINSRLARHSDDGRIPKAGIKTMQHQRTDGHVELHSKGGSSTTPYRSSRNESQKPPVRGITTSTSSSGSEKEKRGMFADDYAYKRVEDFVRSGHKEYDFKTEGKRGGLGHPAMEKNLRAGATERAARYRDKYDVKVKQPHRRQQERRGSRSDNSVFSDDDELFKMNRDRSKQVRKRHHEVDNRSFKSVGF